MMPRWWMIVAICCMCLQRMCAFEDVITVPFVAVDDSCVEEYCEYIKQGESAYRIGLFRLAQISFQKAFDCRDIACEERCLALVELSAAYLGNGDWSAFVGLYPQFMSMIEKCNDDGIKNRLRLHAVIASALSGNFVGCVDLFAKIDGSQLLMSERCWMLAMHSIVAIINDDVDLAFDIQKEALSAVMSSSQSIQVQALIMQFFMQLSEKCDVSVLLERSRLLYEQYGSQKDGYQFVRMYALLLKQAGRNDEAEYIIKQQLNIIDRDDIQSIFLLKLCYAIIHGIHNNDGYALLSDILHADVKDEIKLLGLRTLVSTAENNTQRMAAYNVLSHETMQKMSRSVFTHVLLSMFKLVVDADDLVAAEHVIKDAQKVFSDECLLKDMYKILAYYVWMRDVKDYRLIIYYLEKAKQLLDNDCEESVYLMSQIGNAFYLSGDYELAKHAYIDVLRTDVQTINYERILCQLVQCDLKLLDFNGAESHLSSFEEHHDTYGDYRWQAELLYVNARINNGQQDVALRRLEKLLKKNYGKISAFYAMKFYLLQAMSFFSVNDYNKAYIVSSNICEILPDNNDIDEVALIISQALFIKGACELHNDKVHVARLTYNRLRNLYIDTEAAMLSYFVEAEYYRNHDDLDIANEILMECAKLWCNYSPFAYYQLACYCRNEGGHYVEQAIQSLSDLISNYDGHQIIYAAKLLLADILRENGRFSDSEVIYESLLKEYPLDMRSHFVELCLAKSIFAQREKGEIFIERARMILERLHSTNGISCDLMIEIDAMYCFVLYHAGCYDQMKNVAWGSLLGCLAYLESLTVDNVYWLLQMAGLLKKNYVMSEINYAEADALSEIIEKLLTMMSKNTP